MALIEFHDISFQYPSGFSAAENVNFRIEQEEGMTIEGHNKASETITAKCERYA